MSKVFLTHRGHFRYACTRIYFRPFKGTPKRTWLTDIATYCRIYEHAGNFCNTSKAPLQWVGDHPMVSLSFLGNDFLWLSKIIIAQFWVCFKVWAKNQYNQQMKTYFVHGWTEQGNPQKSVLSESWNHSISASCIYLLSYMYILRIYLLSRSTCTFCYIIESLGDDR